LIPLYHLSDNKCLELKEQAQYLKKPTGDYFLIAFPNIGVDLIVRPELLFKFMK
jgi:hypothetical protein